MMKLQIESEDRIGISQEILAKIAELSINLKAVEVETGVTYIHLKPSQITFEQIQGVIESINGVKACCLVNLMPVEQRERHLKALLAKIPDALLDVDKNGVILAANQAAKLIFATENSQLEGLSIQHILPIELVETFLSASVRELTIADHAFIVETTPIMSAQQVTGSLLSFRAVSAIGRQMSMMQQRDEQELDNIIGQCDAIASLKQKAKQYAKLMLPVLITGETGTGKELFARAVHQASDRAKSPFLAINCAAIPENLLESELFGYASGAFTGARKGGKPGLFELAEGGTVFLDEIAEMSPYLQAKLLRFLQDFQYRRVGGTREIKADVRIISATHQDLTQLVTSNQFRDDLYYRLNVLTLHLPPLRERQQDISALSQFFIAKAAIQINRATPLLAESALQLLKSMSWPGNIRQLQNVLFRLVALCEKQTITETDIHQVMSHQLEQDNPELLEHHHENHQDIEYSDWKQAQQAFEKQLLSKLFPLYPSSRKLAKRLKVSHNTMALKLKQYQINRQ